MGVKRFVMRPPPPVVVGRLLAPGPVAVPADFMGWQMHRWPSNTQGPVSPAPAFGFGAYRTHDYSGKRPASNAWYGIESSQGVYDWSSPDDIFTAHYVGAGRSILYTISGTPTWAAKATPTGNDPYGRVRGMNPPAVIGGDGLYTDLKNFITALVNRYTGKIKWIQVWNEPAYPGGAGGFWAGSASEMARVARTIYTAAKAVDPAIIILHPSDLGPMAYSYTTDFLAASDGVGDGKFGRDWVEGYTIHTYNSSGMRNLDDQWGYGEFERLRQRIVAGGGNPALPIIVTEFSPENPWFYRVPTGNLKNSYLLRKYAQYAAQGIQAAFAYAYDNDGRINVPKVPGLAEELDRFHTRVCGQTITNAWRRSDGSIKLDLADGSSEVF